MVWNYRVVRRKGSGIGEGLEDYRIFSAYYEEHGGKPALAEDPAYPCGETLDELREDLKKMLAALDEPVFDEAGAVQVCRYCGGPGGCECPADYEA